MRYAHFSKSERLELSILLKKGYSLRAIASALKRNHSSVIRELRRNRVRGRYDPHRAQHKAYVKRKYSKYQGMKVREDSWMEQYIQDRLQRYWSPDEIAGRLRFVYGRNIITAKGIYKWLYSQYGQRWCRYLASSRYRPKRRKESKKNKKEIIPNRVSIEQRPRIVSIRKRCGDFEGDTLGVPRTSTATVAALLDRKSRYLLAKKICRLRYAMDGFKELSTPFSVYSCTLDNGVENARHQELGIPTYFCHPYSSWEKGSVENAFLRLRRFIPKKARIDEYSQEDIMSICDTMNNTPRKCLGYRTPKEVFQQEQGRIPISQSLPEVVHLRG